MTGWTDEARRKSAEVRRRKAAANAPAAATKKAASAAEGDAVARARVKKVLNKNGTINWDAFNRSARAAQAQIKKGGASPYGRDLQNAAAEAIKRSKPSARKVGPTFDADTKARLHKQAERSNTRRRVESNIGKNRKARQSSRRKVW